MFSPSVNIYVSEESEQILSDMAESDDFYIPKST